MINEKFFVITPLVLTAFLLISYVFLRRRDEINSFIVNELQITVISFFWSSASIIFAIQIICHLLNESDKIKNSLNDIPFNYILVAPIWIIGQSIRNIIFVFFTQDRTIIINDLQAWERFKKKCSEETLEPIGQLENSINEYNQDRTITIRNIEAWERFKEKCSRNNVTPIDRLEELINEYNSDNQNGDSTQ